MADGDSFMDAPSRLNRPDGGDRPGVFRVTFALPFVIDHVHCYLVASDGGVDGRRHGARAAGCPRWMERVLDGIDA